MSKKIYLAGPDVFLEDAAEIGRAKIAICAQHGLDGIFPGIDCGLDEIETPYDRGLFIYDETEKMLRACDATIVNMTPFHGPSMDVGSAYEMGFIRALGKPVFGYSNVTEVLADRVVAFWDGDVRIRDNGRREGADRMAIEDFDMGDNLMLAGCVTRSTGISVARAADKDKLYRALDGFEECVIRAAEWFNTRG